ncbi:hypothetical protein RRG08_045409 [Elysia crispata]|uniref:Uncharacterized protein n=1 Tax=Elysia crispata TaxID=231223 RepID=A0AAE1CIT2_9GAST|nr:hypothetical protein RRG08_045409 [Elysia crispata]
MSHRIIDIITALSINERVARFFYKCGKGVGWGGVGAAEITPNTPISLIFWLVSSETRINSDRNENRTESRTTGSRLGLARLLQSLRECERSSLIRSEGVQKKVSHTRYHRKKPR